MSLAVDFIVQLIKKKEKKKNKKTFTTYIYLDGFGKSMTIFVQKCIFFSPLLKKNWGKKKHFLAISQKYNF